MAPSACSRSKAGFARRAALWLAAALWLGTAGASDEPPEGATGLRSVPPSASASKDMAAAANPWAVRAGLQVLHEGGSAIDAAIAMQLVLTLVEPQSSGIGGGAFLMHWDGQRVQAYDGRETAPMAASEDQFIGPNGQPLSFRDAVASGLSVGVPGVLRMLELAHHQHGRLKWATLFEPAIDLAQRGFAVSPRLHALLERDPLLPNNAAARAYFYDAQGRALPVGTMLRNPALAQTLRAVANAGADAFYRGPIAADIVRAARTSPHHPGRITEADLAAYQARERDPICATYRSWNVCGMPPPSSAGITIGQILGILGRFDLESYQPLAGEHGLQPQAQAVHLITEAERLAFADRNLYLADSDFIHVDAAALLDPAYLAERAKQIGERSIGEARAGALRQAGARLAPDRSEPRKSTSHLSVADQWGHVVAMTTSIEAAFGSRIFVRGFLLNNELTDFSFEPRARGADGVIAADAPPVANRVQPGKRPLSSMAPTLVFERSSGRLVASLGSPGGTWIISFVTKTLIGLLDWRMDVEQAIALPNFGSRNGPTELEAGRFDSTLIQQLQARGHTVVQMPMTSGLQAIVAAPRPESGARWVGGADPRREGVARGD
ncbi:MAG TPA: gamma-glutamyltransferase [Burkholderiaceae bacterium]|nr:gamma-glutamyltransferase [Burkholderiaceae bacterium]